MAADDIYAKPVSIEDLRLFKALTPLAADAVAQLTEIEKLDISDFSEQEVRSFVIDPIVRILGYRKGTDFSVDLGKRIEFLDKNRFPDYKFNLWQENFWLIEAKRPNFREASFGYDELAQAVEYAVHPEIDAALVVLCDGRKIEIYDREVSLTKFILHIDREHLVRDFDQIRYLLEPMQVWFFQKRRIVRLIDKVFDKEFNMQRLEEFKGLIDRRLGSKRNIVLENFRRNVKPDTEDERKAIAAAPIEDLIDIHFFIEHSIPSTNTLIDTVVARSEPNSFHALYRIFPDLPRDANDIYYPHAAAYLMALGKKQPTVPWLPAWLAPGRQAGASVEDATRHLLKLCLSYFDGDDARKIALLASAAFRRVFKLLLLSDESQWHAGEVLHAFARYHVEELSWRQIVSSPEGHIAGLIQSRTMLAAHQFVAQCRGDRSEFKTEVAKLRLRELWNIEKKIVQSVRNYAAICKERNLGDMRITEAASVTYDVLGHTTLCFLHRFPDWIAYVLDHHRPLVETLAAMNSWKARELLGIPREQKLEPVSDLDLANRFFLGDTAILSVLRAGYAGLV
jgi:hypothetical protein